MATGPYIHNPASNWNPVFLDNHFSFFRFGICRQILFGVMMISLFMSCSPRNPLVDIINNDPQLKAIAYDSMYEVQILYTEFKNKGKDLKTYTFNTDPGKYFYPASTVKLPVAILTLQKVKELQDSGIDVTIDDDMLTGQSREAQSPAFSDSTTTSGKPNIRRYIEKIFAVSDNDAYNRLYEFLGADYINTSLQKMGLNKGTVINHRVGVSGYDYEENRHTNPVRFFRAGKMLYDKPAARDTVNWKHKAKKAVKGIGFIDSEGVLVNKPFDFSLKNFYSLADLHATMLRVIVPEKFRPDERFKLKAGDYSFLRKVMSEYPSSYPFYARDSSYYDYYVKFLIHGAAQTEVTDKDVVIYNKVGDAYGYLLDCAYIEDKISGRSFFLTAVIHVNQNRIYNDGIYEYDSIGFPFLAGLGQKVLEYERKKSKNLE